MPKLTFSQDELIAHCCPVCHEYFILEEVFTNKKERDGDTIFCPNGHELEHK